MKQKLIFVLAGVILLVMPLLAACQTTPTAPPTAPPTTTAPPAVIKLVLSDHNPPKTPISDAMVAYAKAIEEGAKGKVQVELVLGGALVTGAEALRAVQGGIADAATYIINPADGFVLNGVISLPFMGWPDATATKKIYADLLQKFPEMRAEWKGVTYPTYLMMPPMQLHFTKKVVKTPADLKGVKVFCAETSSADVIAALGGTPVVQPIQDMYSIIEKGVAEGCMNHFPVTQVFGALDLLKSHTIIGKGGAYMVPAGVVFSEKTYASLPADVKKVVDDAAAAWYNTAYEADKAFIALTEGIARDRGDTMTQISGADLDVWYKAIKGPIHDRWLKDAGPAGQKVYDEALKQIKASQ